MPQSIALGLALALLVPTLTSANTLLVANKSEATVSFLDLDSGRVVATIPTGAGPHEIAVSPDGRTAVVADYGQETPGRTLTVIDVAGARVERTIDLGEHRRPHGIAFLPDGRRLVVTVEESQALLVIDVERGAVERMIETRERISHMVALGPEGSRAFVANIESGSMTALDLSHGRRLATVATGEGAEGIAASPDGREVWVTNRAADSVTLVDAKTLEIITEVASASFPIRAEITPDGRHVLVTNARSGDLSVIDARERRVARRVPLKLSARDAQGRLFGDRFGESSVPIGIEIAPDGKRAYIAHAGADVIQVLDLESWQPIGVLEAGREPDGMGYTRVRIQPASGSSPETATP